MLWYVELQVYHYAEREWFEAFLVGVLEDVCQVVACIECPTAELYSEQCLCLECIELFEVASCVMFFLRPVFMIYGFESCMGVAIVQAAYKSCMYV